MIDPIGAGGNMPVDTGFLRASIMVQRNALTAQTTTNDAGTPVPQRNEYLLEIAQVKGGDTIFVAFTANYAKYKENKHAFMRLAAQNWTTTVGTVTMELKTRAGA